MRLYLDAAPLIYRFLKTPDAIHLASASLSRCELFLTHDRALERCSELEIEVMAE